MNTNMLMYALCHQLSQAAFSYFLSSNPPVCRNCGAGGDQVNFGNAKTLRAPECSVNRSISFSLMQTCLWEWGQLPSWILACKLHASTSNTYYYKEAGGRPLQENISQEGKEVSECQKLGIWFFEHFPFVTSRLWEKYNQHIFSSPHVLSFPFFLFTAVRLPSHLLALYIHCVIKAAEGSRWNLFSKQSNLLMGWVSCPN